MRETHSRVQEFLRQPSVASQDFGMRKYAELLLGYLEDLGFNDLELVKTDRRARAASDMVREA